KKPSLLAALSNPAQYRQQLKNHQQARRQAHFAALTTELRKRVPDPVVLKREIAKLGRSFRLQSLTHSAEIPQTREERLADFEASQAIVRGVEKSLPYLK